MEINKHKDSQDQDQDQGKGFIQLPLVSCERGDFFVPDYGGAIKWSNGISRPIWAELCYCSCKQ